MRLLLCCAMSAGLFLSACSATQPVRPDKAGSIAPTQTVVVIRGLGKVMSNGRPLPSCDAWRLRSATTGTLVACRR